MHLNIKNIFCFPDNHRLILKDADYYLMGAAEEISFLSRCLEKSGDVQGVELCGQYLQSLRAASSVFETLCARVQGVAHAS